MTITSRASSALTHTVASLATSAGRTVGRCSTAYDNTTNRDENLAVSVLFTTGTTPTAGVVEAWAFQEREDGTWPDIFTTTYAAVDGGFTVKSRDSLRAGAVLIGSVANDTTSDRAYVLQPRDIAMLLGTVYVRKFAVFITHSSVAAANATAGNHETIVLPSYYA